MAHRCVNMQSTIVSRSYADALVESAQDKNVLDDVYSDVDTLRSYMEENELVAEFLASPAHSKERKNEVLKQLCDQVQMNGVTRNFLGVLVQKERAGQLPAILNDFEDLYCEVTDTMKAEVRSAIELSEQQQLQIAKKIKSLTGANNVKLKPTVDESLMGGFVVQFGSDGSGFIDQSVKGALEDLGQQLSADTLTV